MKLLDKIDMYLDEGDSVEIDYIDYRPKRPKRLRKKFKTQKAFEKWLEKNGDDVEVQAFLNEINKKQFETEITKAKGDKKELTRISKSLDDLKGILPEQFISFLKKKIEKAK